MKTALILTTGILALVLPTAAFAGKGNGEKKAFKKEARATLKKFDVNANGQIDGEERTALTTAFAGDPELKPLDKNQDGKLEADEIDAIKTKTKKKK